MYGFWLGRYCGGLLYQFGGFWPIPEEKPPGGLPVPPGLKNGPEPKTNGGLYGFCGWILCGEFMEKTFEPG